MRPASIRVQQSNGFYNYTLGFRLTDIDLLKTAAKALKTGIASSAFLSDGKFIYRNENGGLEVEVIQTKGRQWDGRKEFTFKKKLPKTAQEDLWPALECLFCEQGIEGAGGYTTKPYLRLPLPPVVLEDDDLELPIFANLKVYSNGIAILSFQLDTTWNDITEDVFIKEIVNLYKRYFKDVWIDATIQKFDSEALLPQAFEDQLTLGGRPLKSRAAKRLIKRMRKKAGKVVGENLTGVSRTFEISGKQVTLHKVFGSADVDQWESNLDLCRSIYTHAISKILEPTRDQREFVHWSPIHWEGRPSITLMRFENQPETKAELLNRFGQSLARIFWRTNETEMKIDLPKDLRPFGDYSLHGNRGILFWTWTRQKGSSNSAWDDSNTNSLIMNHQARSEHIEYYNMNIARACAISRSPPSEFHLVEAFQTLNLAESDLHHAGQAGELTDALKHLLNSFGTLDLIDSAKESARWHLESMRYGAENSRLRVDRLLTLVFGIVGTTGLAEFLVEPYLKTVISCTNEAWINTLSFFVAAIFVLFLLFTLWITGRKK